jgi:hypothetical protein
LWIGSGRERQQIAVPGVAHATAASRVTVSLLVGLEADTVCMVGLVQDHKDWAQQWRKVLHMGLLLEADHCTTAMCWWDTEHRTGHLLRLPR